MGGSMNILEKCIVKPEKKFRLSGADPDSTLGLKDKEEAKVLLQENRKKLGELQEVFYASREKGLIIVLQAMDAGGKDGTIRHVMHGVNPQGCRVAGFKAPSTDELSRDYLWRIHQQVPPRGEIAIFNRSHYEDVLVVRVHSLAPKGTWSRRYHHINEFERMLVEEGFIIRKFFLYISKDEQKKRFEERLRDRRKNWKFSLGDVEERAYWDTYMEAFEDVVNKCSTSEAPWFVIPSDRKWVRNVAVSSILVKTLEDLRLEFPAPREDLSKIKID